MQTSSTQTFVDDSFSAWVCADTMNGLETFALCWLFVIVGKKPQCESGWEQVNIYYLFFDA